MIVTTTAIVEDSPVRQYIGVATGEVIMAANVGRDLLASFRDLVGGRSKAYETKLREARDAAFAEMTQQASEMGANAVIGVNINYEVIRQGMLMVAVSGTAVII
ncbi:heavy metal-binding domain-containing protein [Paenibacillus sp. JCM 10914]|uniref:YbjQ family protein n=1 Tax=Paenibacillus sp. JCM 10914 TaxID=1236974 RepID=UPI0003CC885A|nr:YbjQ family protein [Paenibacillus sp. JCM 10914]GAE06528.1 PlcB, ORFX, ORFP, ORFB, ORFA, ldh gene [Paenibacillus sp. JCM 10914]